MAAFSLCWPASHQQVRTIPSILGNWIVGKTLHLPHLSFIHSSSSVQTIIRNIIDLERLDRNLSVQCIRIIFLNCKFQAELEIRIGLLFGGFCPPH